MAQDSRAPTGLTGRRRRLSDEETEGRMLEAALAMVNASGLTVSLEHISFEDVIRDAGVSRSAVYRRWPYKDLFFSDLLKELAKTMSPTGIRSDAESADLVGRVALERLDWLETPKGRAALLIEMLRQGATRDFEASYGSTQSRTYLAVQATFLSLTDSELANEVREALAEAERAHVAQISAAHEQLTGLFGYRLRPELGVTFETLARLVSATIRGLVGTAASVPDIASQRFEATPPGAAGAEEWSTPALGVTAIALTFLEPDPSVEWTNERLADVEDALTSGSWARS
ncbi:MAG: TetR/AcrR family transcriptional regulator [Streptosporangiales bacterium]